MISYVPLQTCGMWNQNTLHSHGTYRQKLLKP